MKKPKVAISMLCYNDFDNLEDAISSVLSQRYESFELIIVDNNSNDGSLDYIEKNFPGLEIVKNKANLGYAKAYKQELRRLFAEKDFDAVVLLNSDVIVGKNWLDELIASAYKRDKIALAQPKIFLHRNGKKTQLANSFGNRMHFLGFGFCGNYGEKDSDLFLDDREIASGSGCCLLVKKEHYLKIGELDDTYEYYLEDQDLSWRAMQMGYQNVLSAKSKMWHKYEFQNERNPRKFMLYERNRLYFIFKNYSTKTILLILPAMLIMEAGVLLDAAMKKALWGKICSYYGFFENVPQLLKARKSSQGKRSATDRELKKHLEASLEFKEIDNLLLRLANKVFIKYFQVIKPLI